MLPGVKGRLRLVAAALLLTVRLAGAHTSEAPADATRHTVSGPWARSAGTCNTKARLTFPRGRRQCDHPQ
jgi:hypothetical protein